MNQEVDARAARDDSAWALPWNEALEKFLKICSFRAQNCILLCQRSKIRYGNLKVKNYFLFLLDFGCVKNYMLENSF